MLKTRKEIALWEAVTRYFKTNKNEWNKLYSILNKETSNVPSLRCIFYYVSKYSKYNIITHIKNSNPFQIYNKYRQMMKVHTKKCFDPFCRKKRVNLTLHNKSIVTNVAQLVFFRWLLSNNVYTDLLNDYPKVLQKMKEERKMKIKINNNTNDLVCMKISIPCNTSFKIKLKFD